MVAVNDSEVLRLACGVTQLAVTIITAAVLKQTLILYQYLSKIRALNIGVCIPTAAQLYMSGIGVRIYIKSTLYNRAVAYCYFLCIRSDLNCVLNCSAAHIKLTATDVDVICDRTAFKRYLTIVLRGNDSCDTFAASYDSAAEAVLDRDISARSSDYPVLNKFHLMTGKVKCKLTAVQRNVVYTGGIACYHYGTALIFFKLCVLHSFFKVGVALCAVAVYYLGVNYAFALTANKIAVSR